MIPQDDREAVIKRLEAALEATDADAKNFCIREAIQLLYMQEEDAPTNVASVDESCE